MARSTFAIIKYNIHNEDVSQRGADELTEVAARTNGRLQCGGGSSGVDGGGEMVVLVAAVMVAVVHR